MGSYGEYHDGLPVIDLSKISPDKDIGSQEWKELCKRVGEACENYGCFEVVYDKISAMSKAEVFSMLKPIFDLPMEFKRKVTDIHSVDEKKNITTRPPPPFDPHYEPSPPTPFLESFGIDDASNYDCVKNFAQIILPHTYQHFSQTMWSLACQIDELIRTIWMLTCESLGLDSKEIESTIKFNTRVTFTKYFRPPPGSTAMGLVPHTDRPMSTILIQDEVSGLEIQTKDGQWIRWKPSPTSLMYLLGDAHVVWSNKRLHAANHRVRLCEEDKERLSLGAFQLPAEGTIINPPKELVDEDHPQFLNDFDFLDYMQFSRTHRATDTIPYHLYLHEYAKKKNLLLN